MTSLISTAPPCTRTFAAPLPSSAISFLRPGVAAPLICQTPSASRQKTSSTPSSGVVTLSMAAPWASSSTTLSPPEAASRKGALSASPEVAASEPSA